MASSTSKLGAINTLRKRLLPEDIVKLSNFLTVPSGLCEDKDPIKCLRKISKWSGFNSSKFLIGLQAIQPTLVESAKQIPWLSSRSETKGKTKTDMSRFVEIVRDGLTFLNWSDILLSHDIDLEEGTDRSEILRICFQREIISTNLSTFIGQVKTIERDDIANQLVSYRELFAKMDSEEFVNEFLKTLTENPKVIGMWRNQLSEFTSGAFDKIEPILGSSQTLQLEEIYTPLTIVKYDPHIQKEQESGKTEIDLLRKMYEEGIENQDFLEMVKESKSEDKKAWILIGNPGSGKTWLCNRIALLYGHGYLIQYQFAISIPCRNQEWHDQEETRITKGHKITSQSLQDWLLLGMPLGTDWAEQLAEHLVKTEGEGLLIIIDSVDEFTKNVPIESTILSALLLRRTLRNSTLLVTSRPAAWNLASTKLSGLQIDQHYQVLGFSPDDRDAYIAKRLDLRKQKLFQKMIDLHEEIALLCLVPVNASLFTALFLLSDDVTANTLTELYTYLFHYLIKRQLTRMRLTEYAKAEKLFELHKDVLQCLYSIGEVAYLGVSARELTSTAHIPLCIQGEKVQDSECLGLVQVQIKETTPGVKTEVWCFSHLTLQEFTAALYLYSIPWTELCLLTRYIVSTREVFNMYRMVLRFSCGLLCDDAASLINIVFRYHLVKPVPYNDMPLIYQLNYDYYDSLNRVSDWYEFTTQFASLSTLIAESHMTPLYKHTSKFLRDNLYFYFVETVPLNEWNNFVTSLSQVDRTIQVIYINLRYFTPEQLQTLLQQLSSCSVRYLALYYYPEMDSDKRESICDVITQSPPLNTKLSIDVIGGKLTELNPLMNVIDSTNQTISSMRLFLVELSENVLKRIFHRITSLQCLDFYPNYSTRERDTSLLLQRLSTTYQLQAFHFHGSSLHEELERDIISAISELTTLREISCIDMKLSYSILPQIQRLSQLSYLNIDPEYGSEFLSQYSEYLLQLIDRNRDTLKGLKLYLLHQIELQSLTPLLDSLHTCTGLLELQLRKSEFIAPILTPHTLPLPLSIVVLEIYSIKLEDSGLLELCNILAYHPAMRRLVVYECSITSVSCEYLCYLIPTLRHLRELIVNKEELTQPEDTPLNKLKQTATRYSVELELL